LDVTFKKRAFALDNRVKFISIKHIYACLGCDRVVSDVVNEMDGPNGIVNLSNCNIINNLLLIV
jgi:hypothetical protein